MKKRAIIAILEGILIVSLIVITPYNLNNLFGDNIVSASKFEKALNSIQRFIEDEDNKINTCVESVDGSLCQLMPRYTCDESCRSGCIEKPREEVAECKLGTCIDEKEGICTPRTPIFACEEKGGTFDERALENIPECRKACCFIGTESRFVTEKQCDVLAKKYGTKVEFVKDITNEAVCILSKVGYVEGACVLQKEAGSEEPNCKRTTLETCESLGGDFHERMLCSHPELDTECEKQNSVSCFDGLEEVYWADSCGNRENVFDLDEVESWNRGFILGKNESCALGSPGDWLANQRSCGNCNRLRGSLCGNVTDESKLIGAPKGDVICKDLGCDVNGTRRENGETWCVYQNAIGTSLEVPLLGALGYFSGFHLNGLHSMSAPGGRHFRQSCIEGEVVTEACADYRNEVCTETRTNITEDGAKSLSIATCRANRWVECLTYNQNGGSPLSELLSQMQPIIDIFPQAGKALGGLTQNEKVNTANLMFRCESNPDCYINSISVDGDYKFPLCLPKYPPGFYMHDAQGEDENICGFGNQRCMTVWVYESVPFTFGAAAEWKCQAGCDCVEGNPPSGAGGSWEGIYPSQKFAQQSQDICVSLGDCGKKANYKGDGGMLFDNSYKFKTRVYDGMPKEDPDAKAKDKIRPRLFGVDDSKPIKGKYIDADYEGLFGKVVDGDGGGGEGGVPVGTRVPSFQPADSTMASLALGGVTGATALGAGIAVKAATIPAVTISEIGLGAPVYTIPGTAPAAGLVAFQAGALGAAIGAAVVSLLVGFSPVGRGVGVGGSIAYGVAGAASFGMISVAYGPNMPLIGGLFAKGAAAGAAGAGAAGAGAGAAGAGAAGAGAAGAGAGASSFAWVGPAGIIIFVIVIVDIIAQWIAGVGSIKTVEAVFECGLWQPQKGSQASCERCGEDGLPCSRYSCETLGKDCEWIMASEGIQGEEGTNACIYSPKNDVNGPIIVELNEEALPKGFAYDSVNVGEPKSSFEIEKRSDSGGCVNQLESFSFGFVLDEVAECRYAFEADSEFDEMEQFGNSLLSKIHADSFSMTEVPFEGEEKKTMSMYIKCRDYASGEQGGNVGEDNVVRFCIDPIDITPPVVVSNTEREVILPANQTTQIIRVEFNEDVSEARLGTTNGAYEELEYKMSCTGRVCSVEVPIEVGRSTFYIKAKDMQGNLNEEGTPIRIIRSERGLTIELISPEEVIETGQIVNQIDLEIRTGGGYDGRASCTFEINGRTAQAFKETGERTHRQTLDRLSPDTYNLVYRCVDMAGNEAVERTSLKLELDNIYPEITRVYGESGTLVIITREKATCSYTKTGCNFRVDEGNIMDGSDMIHTTSLDYNSQYHVKCKDEHGNEPGVCNLVVRRGEL